MAKKISELPVVTTPLAGTEQLEVNQSGTSKRATVEELQSKVYLTVKMDDITTSNVVYVVSPISGTITKVWSVIFGSISISDITITGNISGGTNFTATLVISQSGSQAGDVDSMTPADNNSISAGQDIRLSSDGAGSGPASAEFTIEITK